MTQGTKRTPARRHIKHEMAEAHGYSRAVATEGGTTVWLAGEAALEDGAGKSLAGDFEGQVREIFAAMNRTLTEAGGSLGNLVTMTVFVTDSRYGEQFWKIRRETFGADFPASAFIVAAGFGHPDVLVEVQGVAVV